MVFYAKSRFFKFIYIDSVNSGMAEEKGMSAETIDLRQANCQWSFFQWVSNLGGGRRCEPLSRALQHFATKVPGLNKDVTY